MDEQYVDFDKPEDPAKQLLDELRALCLCDIKDMYDTDNCLRPVKDMPEGIRKSIAAIEIEELFSGSGHARELIGYTKKVKLWDKKAAIETFMKHLGMFVERVEKTVKVEATVTHVELEDRIAEITKNRVTGVN
jgi:phage terminase small subunit